MIHTKDSKRSLVIPKWQSIRRAWNSSENRSLNKSVIAINLQTSLELEKEYDDFKRSPTIANATDLLSSAFVINNLSVAKEVAKYLENVNDLHPATFKLVKRVLYGRQIEEEEDIKLINVDISQIRNKLKIYPKNPLLWIELGRLFTIKGLTKKANKAVSIALNLAPYERYIVRSGFRFFIHNDEFDKAFYFAKKAAQYSSDPWLKALEVNAAILNNFNLSSLKKLNIKTIPNNFIYHFSELIESIGMIELNYGNESKAKKNFKLAWSDPSLNVIAHGEWVLRNRFPSMQTPSSLDFTRSYEAATWRYFYELELENAVLSSRSWILEEPYSSHPYTLSSGLLCLIDKPKDSIVTAKAGLISNPQDLSLKNNLAYSYLLANDLSNAEYILLNFPRNIPDHNNIFFLATKGLLAYKKGNIELGRKLYSESIELSNRLQEHNLAMKAFMNLTLIELELQTAEAMSIAQQSLQLSINSEDPAVKILRNKIANLLSLIKNTSN